jgi:prepilin-type processing-associated H-X9-DG protein
MATVKRGPNRVMAAFTLVELLVVIAVLLLLISMLLPSLRKARDQAKAVCCGAALRGFGAGLNVYASENDDWIPGRNTTGVEVWEASLDGIFGDHDALERSDMPVQVYDWMTPILRTTTNLPHCRAKRFRLLLDEYSCRQVNFTSDLYTSGRNPYDQPIFDDEVNEHGKYKGISYLMPGYFQFWGSEDAAGRILAKHKAGPAEFTLDVRDPGTFFNVQMQRYKSKVSCVGTPAKKIAVADGTRYLPMPKGPLDFDHHYNPELRPPDDSGWYGSFSSSGAWWTGSRAYGVNSPSKGGNIPLSYRHNNGIEALFFDSHVEYLSQKQSRKIEYWYPKGAKVTHAEQGSADFATYEEGYVIR